MTSREFRASGIRRPALTVLTLPRAAGVEVTWSGCSRQLRRRTCNAGSQPSKEFANYSLRSKSPGSAIWADTNAARSVAGVPERAEMPNSRSVKQ
jgi:hypothetical protein